MLHSTFELANDKVKLSQIKLHHRTYPPKLKIQEMTLKRGMKTECEKE